MAALPLSLFEREEIRVGIEAGWSVAHIAEGLGRHRCTVHREISRNGGRQRYRAARADRRAERCRRRPKVPKLVADPVLAAEVTARLVAKDSPKRISIELAARDMHISHETIYRSLQQSPPLLGKKLHKNLHLGRRRRKQRRNTPRNSTSSLGIICRIHDRPDTANNRSEIGHLEGDLIVGAYNQSALITLFDRYSRFLWLLETKSKTAEAVATALTQHLPTTGAKTLTWDCGAEIAHHPRIALATSVDIYIADPKSPWQRPTNEAGNALVRRYVGKGTNLNHYTRTDLDWIQSRINTIPRRSLNWATAHNTYTAAVATTG